jgi:hypothetical protein
MAERDGIRNELTAEFEAETTGDGLPLAAAGKTAFDTNITTFRICEMEQANTLRPIGGNPDGAGCFT